MDCRCCGARGVMSRAGSRGSQSNREKTVAKPLALVCVTDAGAGFCEHR
jgi:hypothetical protein